MLATQNYENLSEFTANVSLNSLKQLQEPLQGSISYEGCFNPFTILSQLATTCSKLIIEALEQSVKFVQS